MNIPPGYGDSTTKGNVCKLKKALYGLKQSPRALFGRFTQTMKTLGYQQSPVECPLCIRAVEDCPHLFFG